MYSRIGKPLHILDQFKSLLPSIFLDGELWCGRGNYKNVQSLLERQNEVPWSSLRYLPFDSPILSPFFLSSSSSSSSSSSLPLSSSHPPSPFPSPFPSKHPSSPPSSTSTSSLSSSSSLSFSLSSSPTTSQLELEERYLSILQEISARHPFVIVVGMKEFTGAGPIHRMAREILDTGGEGIIARKFNSSYFRGRSFEFVKLKAARDLEGLVMAEFSDQTFDIQLPNDETVNAKLAPNMETEPPKIGDVVTLAYERFTNMGTLVMPRIVRIRKDMGWDDVESNIKKSPNVLGYRTLGKERPTETHKEIQKYNQRFKQHARGHWTVEGSKNVKSFFDDYCKELNRDPLDPKSWYDIHIKDIISRPSGGSVLKHYNGSVVKALMDVYPSLNLDPIDFDHMLHRYWQKYDNRRRFFDNVAKRFKFDPLIPSNWYSLVPSKYSDEKGYTSLVAYYNGSLSKGLSDVYPDIGIDIINFKNVTRRFWRTSSNRKKFFDAFAKRRNFDPLIAENWYDTSRNTLISEKGGVSVMAKHYNFSLANALRDVYPTIQMDTSKFSDAIGNYFHSVANRRKFLEDFAMKKGFDPLSAVGWKLYSEKDINLILEGKHVLNRYGGRLDLALASLFPEMCNQNENN